MSMDGLLLLFAVFGGFGALSTHKAAATEAFHIRMDTAEKDRKLTVQKQLHFIQIGL